MANAGRNFSLTDRHSRFVDAQVASGRHASGSEVVREALRRYEDDVESELAYRERLRDVIAAAEGDIAAGRFKVVKTPEKAEALVRSLRRHRAEA